MPPPEIDSDGATVTPPIKELNVQDSTLGNAGVEQPKEQRCSYVSPFSLFENLPAEIRDNILLHIPDLPTLRSLVRASPTMHAQYRINRDTLLRTCLAREMDGCFVDAYACVKSRVCQIGPVRTDEKIADFLTSYAAWLSGSRPCPPLKSLDSSLCRWLAAFHVSVVRPLGHRYAAWALANLARKAVPSSLGRKPAEAEAEAAPDPQPTLSRSEEIRIFRALYRYETFCHLFGRNDGLRRGGFQQEAMNEMFLCLFDPWEAEAIGCIDLFMRDKYKYIFLELKSNLANADPKFVDPARRFSPEDSVWLDMNWDEYMDGTTSRGLEMLARLVAITNHETLAATVDRCITHYHGPDAPARKMFLDVTQNCRREESTTPDPRDEAQGARIPMKFGGDVVPPNGPPLAWVLLWGGVYANLYGEYTPRSLRDWGYVMWDERRWIEMGTKDLVPSQWKTARRAIEEMEDFYGWRPVGY